MRYAAFILLQIIFLFSLNAENVVIDSISRSRVPGAALFTSRGHISDISDSIGSYSSPSVFDYPLLIRALGYEETRITSPSDTIVLQSALPMLPPDTTSTTKGKPVRRVLAYVREYTTIVTSSDSLKIFSEGNIEFLLPSGADRKRKRGEDWRVLFSRSQSERLGSEGRKLKTLEGTENNFSPFLGILPLWHDTLSVAAKGLSPLPDGFLLSLSPLEGMKNSEWNPTQLRLNGMNSAISSISQKYLFGQSTDSITTGPLRATGLSIVATATGPAIKRLYGLPEDFLILTYIEVFPYAYEALSTRQALNITRLPSPRHITNPLSRRQKSEVGL